MTASFLARQEGLDARFEAIEQTEREIEAAFARRAAQVDEARRFSEATAPSEVVPGGRWSPGMVAEREFVSELAVRLRFPQRTTENPIEASRALAEELPGTRAALAAGLISYRHAQILIEQAGSVPDAAKAGLTLTGWRRSGSTTPPRRSTPHITGSASPPRAYRDRACKARPSLARCPNCGRMCSPTCSWTVSPPPGSAKGSAPP